MERPDLRLERIHRQAQGNPILSLAELVRGGGDPREFAPAEAGSIQGTQERDHGRGRGRVRIVRGLDLAEVHQAFGVGPAGSAPLEAGPSRGGRFGGRPLEAAVLCYKNRTRVWLNQRIREGLGHRRELVPGDVVICLRNVTVDSVRLFNGMRGLVQAVRPEGEHHLRTDIFFPDDGLRLRDGRLLRHQLGRPYTFADFPSIAKVTGSEVRSWDEAGLLFDHGYALTVHKSQGSQFCRVVLVAEPGLPGDAPAKRARWLYTGVTRASEQLSVLIP
jgi:exodeoxyribonuclease-5